RSDDIGSRPVGLYPAASSRRCPVSGYVAADCKSAFRSGPVRVAVQSDEPDGGALVDDGVPGRAGTALVTGRDGAGAGRLRAVRSWAASVSSRNPFWGSSTCVNTR